MGMLGFPTEGEMRELLGVVTEEDRQRWEALEDQARGESADRRRNTVGRDSLHQGMTPALGLSEQVLGNRLQAEQSTAARKRDDLRLKEMPEEEVVTTTTRRKSRVILDEDAPMDRGSGMEF